MIGIHSQVCCPGNFWVKTGGQRDERAVSSTGHPQVNHDMSRVVHRVVPSVCTQRDRGKRTVRHDGQPCRACDLIRFVNSVTWL